MEFRQARPDDAPLLLELIHAAYRGPAVGWATEADLLAGQRTDAAELEEALTADPARLLTLLAYDVVQVASAAVPAAGPETVLGCVRLERVGPDLATLGTFAVWPHLQGRGVGDALMAEAERVVQQRWRVTRMELTVIVQRRTLAAYYERRGYAATGEQRPFPYGQERFGRPLRPDLAFAVHEKALAGG